jgi:hypothetical protein
MKDGGSEGGVLWFGLRTSAGRIEDFANADNQSRRGFCCRFLVFLLGTGIAQKPKVASRAAHLVAAGRIEVLRLYCCEFRRRSALVEELFDNLSHLGQLAKPGKEGHERTNPRLG